MHLLALLSVTIALLCVHVADANCIPTAASIASRQEPANYEILGEKEVYSRWRTVIQRQVRYPKGNIVDFDVSEDVSLLWHFTRNASFISHLLLSRHLALANDARRTSLRRFKTKREPEP